jgi:hypothetical protein
MVMLLFVPVAVTTGRPRMVGGCRCCSGLSRHRHPAFEPYHLSQV